MALKVARGGWAAVGLLAVSTFVVGTSELVIAGILPTVANDLGVSVAQAGYLVTAYALSFAIVTPLVALWSGDWERKRLLVGCLVVFAVGNALSIVAANFELLMMARVVSAASAGVFEVIATAAAAALVPEQQRGRAIALVVSGFSVALLVGVPLGTLVGLAWGWRTVFVALLVLGLVALAGILVFMPRVAREQAQQTPRQLLQRPDVLGALGGTALAFMGVYITWTYVAPFLEEITGLPAQAVAGVLLLLGLGSVVGNAIAGHTADRYGARPTVLVSGSVMAVGLAGISLLGQQPLATIAAFALFGTATGVFVPAQQTRLVALAPKGPEFALALNLGALNLGISVGAAIGSGIVDRGGLASVGYFSALVATLAVGLTASTTARS